jgi:hypothetical protein
MQEDDMATRNGLCLTCMYSEHCAFRKDSRSGVQFCEEYKTAGLHAPDPPGIAAVAKIAERNPRVKGLCANCSYYAVCTFPKPEAGVWHCEEYR